MYAAMSRSARKAQNAEVANLRVNGQAIAGHGAVPVGGGEPARNAAPVIPERFEYAMQER
jgi:hypothetical protein